MGKTTDQVLMRVCVEDFKMSHVPIKNINTIFHVISHKYVLITELDIDEKKLYLQYEIK